MPRGEQLLKMWNDWSAGIGYVRDDGRTPGLYYAAGLLGSMNELRAAPFINSVNYSNVLNDANYIATYFFDENATDTQSYLYAVMNHVSTSTARLLKIRTDTTNFGTAAEVVSATEVLYRPARYQGKWYVSGTALMHQLTTINAPPAGDSWTTNAGGQGEMLMMLSHQLSQATMNSGVRILAEDGSPLTGVWGSYFNAGDKNEQIQDLFVIQGFVFVVKRSGLYSFGVKNDRTISGMVLEDFGRWRYTLNTRPCTLWKGGAAIPHPAGLLYYTPGDLFTMIGFENKLESTGLPPSGVTELVVGGRYHSVTSVGDYLYTVYQTDPNATTGLLLCGYSPTNQLTDTAWQCLGSITLKNATSGKACHGIEGAATSFPENSVEPNPTLWLSNAAAGNTHLSYIILDSRGQPMRTRANVHKIVTSGDAWMPLLIFDEPITLSRLVVYVDDMGSGDEWQFSAVVNDTGSDVKIGAPVISGGRHERSFGQGSIYQFSLHVAFTGTLTTSRVPPSIRRIELWGPESVT